MLLEISRARVVDTKTEHSYKVTVCYVVKMEKSVKDFVPSVLPKLYTCPICRLYTV